MKFRNRSLVSPFVRIDPFRADRIRNEVAVEDIEEEEISPVDEKEENEEDGWSDVSV
jgi:hypothetical protein